MYVAEDGISEKIHLTDDFKAEMNIIKNKSSFISYGEGINIWWPESYLKSLLP